MKLHEISLARFLEIYCGITNENIKAIMTHKDAKILLPYLKSCSFDFLRKNMELYETGDIILVRDANNNLIPYLTPKFRKEDTIDEISMIVCEKKLVVDYYSIDLDDLTVYELKELLHLFKDSRSKAREIKNELTNRGVVKSKNKKKELKYSYACKKEDYL